MTEQEQRAAEALWLQRCAENREADVIEQLHLIRAAVVRMGDEVERVVRDQAEGHCGIENAAQRVQHAALWGLANLGLDRLTDRLTDYHRARREADVALALSGQAGQSPAAAEPYDHIDQPH